MYASLLHNFWCSRICGRHTIHILRWDINHLPSHSKYTIHHAIISSHLRQRSMYIMNAQSIRKEFHYDDMCGCFYRFSANFIWIVYDEHYLFTQVYRGKQIIKYWFIHIFNQLPLWLGVVIHTIEQQDRSFTKFRAAIAFLSTWNKCRSAR